MDIVIMLRKRGYLMRWNLLSFYSKSFARQAREAEGWGRGYLDSSMIWATGLYLGELGIWGSVGLVGSLYLFCFSSSGWLL